MSRVWCPSQEGPRVCEPLGCLPLQPLKTKREKQAREDCGLNEPIGMKGKFLFSTCL